MLVGDRFTTSPGGQETLEYWDVSGRVWPAGQGDDPAPLLGPSEAHLQWCIHFWIPWCNRHGGLGVGPAEDRGGQ